MQNWKDLYKELCTIITTAVPSVKWQDLWHNQVNFLEEEHPFPAPAVFYMFRVNETNDMGGKVQNIGLQIIVYVYYETFADTYNGSWNQDSALGFMDIITDVFKALHGSSGANYSEMRRLPGMSPVDTGGAGNLYQIPFYCELIDESAAPVYDETQDDLNMTFTKGTPPEKDLGNLYVIPG